MKSWTIALTIPLITWCLNSEAGLGLFKSRGGTVATIPGTTAGYPVALGMIGTTYPSAYTVPGSAAYPTGYVTPGTAYSRGYSSSVATVPGPELIDNNPPTRPYSYYAAPNGMARGYYGYGEDQFPYYGRAYGHPYDPWTWPYMTYGYQNSLNRYYAPPLP